MDNASVVQEVTRVIAGVVRDHNRMWADGFISEDSALLYVEEGLTAVQYAPHFENGVWRAGSADDWLHGTTQAAEASRGQGWTWSMHDLQVLPRSEQEAVASYRIVHNWGDTDRPPAQAMFLETWRRGGDGCWRLARHTAEKL